MSTYFHSASQSCLILSANCRYNLRLFRLFRGDSSGMDKSSSAKRFLYGDVVKGKPSPTGTGRTKKKPWRKRQSRSWRFSFDKYFRAFFYLFLFLKYFTLSFFSILFLPTTFTHTHTHTHTYTHDPRPLPTTHDPRHLATIVNITCYFHMWRYQVFARKLTWYSIGVYQERMS